MGVGSLKDIGQGREYVLPDVDHMSRQDAGLDLDSREAYLEFSGPVSKERAGGQRPTKVIMICLLCLMFF